MLGRNIVILLPFIVGVLAAPVAVKSGRSNMTVSRFHDTILTYQRLYEYGHCQTWA